MNYKEVPENNTPKEEIETYIDYSVRENDFNYFALSYGNFEYLRAGNRIEKVEILRNKQDEKPIEITVWNNKAKERILYYQNVRWSEEMKEKKIKKLNKNIL